MNHGLPDLRLLRAFGNESVLHEKLAGAESLAARFAVGLMEANRSLDNRRKDEELAAHAARMNLAFRVMEDRMMAPVRENSTHTRMPMLLMALSQHGREGGGVSGADVPLGMDEGMVRMASAIGRDLAAELQKEAGIGQSLGAIGAGMKSMGQGAGKSLLGGLQRAGGALQKLPGVASIKPPSLGAGASSGAGGLLQAAKGKLMGTAQGVQKGVSNALGGVTPKTPMPASAVPKVIPKAPSAAVAPSPAKAAPMGAPSPAAPKAPVGTAPKPPGAPTGTPSPTPTQPSASPQPPGGEGGGFDIQKAWERTGLSGDKWKTKVPALIAGAGAAYGLYAGAKKGLEVLGREQEPARYNEGGAVPAYGVNQYGVPDRSTPFM